MHTVIVENHVTASDRNAVDGLELIQSVNRAKVSLSQRSFKCEGQHLRLKVTDK